MAWLGSSLQTLLSSLVSSCDKTLFQGRVRVTEQILVRKAEFLNARRRKEKI